MEALGVEVGLRLGQPIRQTLALAFKQNSELILSSTTHTLTSFLTIIVHRNTAPELEAISSRTMARPSQFQTLTIFFIHIHNALTSNDKPFISKESSQQDNANIDTAKSNESFSKKDRSQAFSRRHELDLSVGEKLNCTPPRPTIAFPPKCFNLVEYTDRSLEFWNKIDRDEQR